MDINEFEIEEYYESDFFEEDNSLEENVSCLLFQVYDKNI